MKNQASTRVKQISYESNPFKVIFRGFNRIFEVNKGWAIAILVIGLVGSFQQFANGPESFGGNSSNISAAAVIGITVAVLALVIVAVVLGVLYKGMVSYVTVKTIEGKSVGFKEALMAAADKFWTLLGIQIVVSLKILGGLLLFIIPGIRAALRYSMVFLPVFDKQLKTFEAIHDMKQLTKDHLIEIFGISTAATIIPFISSVLGVGGHIVMYEQLRELKDSKAPKPKVHWLNYLGFVLLAALFLLIALIVLVVAAVAHK